MVVGLWFMSSKLWFRRFISSGHVSISREGKAIFVVKLEKNDNRHKAKDYE